MSTPAVGYERVSSIIGYKITKGDFKESSPNLPMRIAILAEANTSSQSVLSTDPVEITSARQAGVMFGFGSPIYLIMRILRPVSGGVVGGIPTVVYPQAEPSGATPKVIKVTITGTATGNGTHTAVIAGRYAMDGVNYDFNVNSGDAPTAIAAKMSDSINNVLGCPFTASAAAGVVTLTSKWAGLTANPIGCFIDSNNAGLGITYAVANESAGSGTPSISASLQKFGAEWNTIVINSYGAEAAIMNALEQFNGRPDPEMPTGRYSGTIMKPFIALTGSTLENPTTITDPRREDCTIAICPAPLSPGLGMEAAANMGALFSRVCQDTPHLDVQEMQYPDMPAPKVIGEMSEYDNRDSIVKKGCSTVMLRSGGYVIIDFVTTYHPTGEEPPQFRYCRNLVLDWNVRFAYYLQERIYVIAHAIAGDNDTVSVQKVIKPKQWKGVVKQLFADLANKGLIVDTAFSEGSMTVGIDSTNPDRLNTFFRYKRSGFCRISSTTAEAGFNFGKL